MYVCILPYTCTYTYIYVYTHIYTYIHTYTYICIYLSLAQSTLTLNQFVHIDVATCRHVRRLRTQVHSNRSVYEWGQVSQTRANCDDSRCSRCHWSLSHYVYLSICVSLYICVSLCVHGPTVMTLAALADTGIFLSTCISESVYLYIYLCRFMYMDQL